MSLCGNQDDTLGVGGAVENLPKEKSKQLEWKTCQCTWLRVQGTKWEGEVDFPQCFSFRA